MYRALDTYIKEIDNVMTHPDFYRDESLRLAKYHATVSLGIQLSEQSQSPEDLTRKWHYLNRLSIIPFYSVENSLIELMRIRGLLLEQCLRPLAKKLRLKIGSSSTRKILIIKPGLNLGPELSSTVAHFKLLSKYFNVTIACQVHPTPDIVRGLSDLGFQLALLPQQIEEMASAIVNFSPDIVIHSSNQSAVSNTQTLLGALRLSPIQIATTMSPVSTGLRQIDFYLTGRDNELPGFSQKYSESLLFVEGDINHYDPAFLEGETPELTLSTSIDKPTESHLFVGGNFNKIGRPSLEAWLDILKATDNTKLVLAPFNPNWQSHYAVNAFKDWIAELCIQSSVNPERIEIIGPFNSREPILARVKSASLYLDTFPYSGAVSILDPITVDTPFITLEGTEARFRQASMQAKRHRAIGIAVANKASYVQRSVEILNRHDRTVAFRGKDKSNLEVNNSRESLSDRILQSILNI